MIGLRVCPNEHLWILHFQHKEYQDFQSISVWPIQTLFKKSKKKFFAEKNANKVIVVHPSKNEEMPYYLYKNVDKTIASIAPDIVEQNMMIYFLNPCPSKVIYSETAFESRIGMNFRTGPINREPKPPIVEVPKTLENRFAGSEIVNTLKKMLIQEAYSQSYPQVIVKAVLKDYKVFLIEIPGAESAMYERIVKFDSPSTIKKELNNCKWIESKLTSSALTSYLSPEDLDSLKNEVFYTIQKPIKSGMDYDIMGCLSLEVGSRRKHSTLEDFLSERLNNTLIENLIGRLRLGLGFLYKMSEINCMSKLIEAEYSDFYKNIMPVNERSKISLKRDKITVHDKASRVGHTIKRIKVRQEGENWVKKLAESDTSKESILLTIRLEKGARGRTYKEDIDLEPIDDSDLFKFYEMGLREGAKVEIDDGCKTNLKDHKYILASELLNWSIFKDLDLEDLSKFYKKTDMELISHIPLKNPLHLYNIIYDNRDPSHNSKEIERLLEKEYSTLWSGKIHGDLNIKNILAELLQDDRTHLKLIDFASLREGPIDSDFARLETDIKVRFLVKTLGEISHYHKCLKVIYKFEKAIYEDPNGTSFIKSLPELIGNEQFNGDFKSKFENCFNMIQYIRNARDKIYEENACLAAEKTSYWVALFFQSLSTLGLGETPTWGKIWAFIAAAIAYEKLTEQIPGLEEGKRVEDGSYVEQESKKYAGEQKKPEVGLQIPDAKGDIGDFTDSVANSREDEWPENSHIPKTQIVQISETQKEIVRIAVAQFCFELTESFPFVLENKDTVKTKVFSALDIAKQNDADIICLPELCLCEEWISEIKKKYANMIIIGGSFYKDNKNLCPVIIRSDLDIPYQPKITPSDSEIGGETRPRMIPGDLFYIYETQFGRFMVLICRDFYNLAHYYRTTDVDMIFCPSYNSADESFQTEAHAHVEKVPSYILIANTGKYGGTSIFGQLHKKHLSSLVDDGCKDAEEVKSNKLAYKLCEVKKRQEEVIFADFNLIHKSVQIPTPADPREEIRSVGHPKKISIECCSESVGDSNKV